MRSPLRILVAEDDSSDRELLMRAFAKAKIDATIQYVEDGQQVIDLLSDWSPGQDPIARPLPTLLLLDLRMPRVDGFEVLQWLWQRPQFQGLVTVAILSGSDEPSSIHRAIALGARHYFMKPDDPRQLVRLLQEIEQYWIGLFPRDLTDCQPEATPEQPYAAVRCG